MTPRSTLVIARFRPDRPQGGAALRNWQNIRALSAIGPVDVVTLGDEERSEHITGVREWIPFSIHRRSIRDRASARLWPLRNDGHPALEPYRHEGAARWIAREGRKRRYDFAVVEELSLARYLKTLRALGCKVVFDAHNVESTLRAELAVSMKREDESPLRSIVAHLKYERLVRIEKRAIQTSDAVWACSVHDEREIERIYGVRAPRVSVVPNGVEVESYRRETAVPLRDDWSTEPVTLAFVGAYSYFPNEGAALRLVREILPAVRARTGAARAMLIGRNPTEDMLTAASSDPEVEVTGSVDSVLPYLERRCIVALPITLGSGTRLKILESFAIGRPVVCTRKAAEGIDATDGEHLLLRDSPAEMAAACVELWHDPEKRARLCSNALDLVRSSYSWDSATERIKASLLAA